MRGGTNSPGTGMRREKAEIVIEATLFDAPVGRPFHGLKAIFRSYLGFRKSLHLG